MSLSGIEKYSQFVDIIDVTNIIRVEMNSDDDSYEFSHKPPY